MSCVQLGPLFAGTWGDSVVPTVTVYTLLASGVLFCVLIFAQKQMSHLIEAGEFERGVAIARYIPAILPSYMVFLLAGLSVILVQILAILVSWSICDSAYIYREPV